MTDWLPLHSSGTQSSCRSSSTAPWSRWAQPRCSTELYLAPAPGPPPPSESCSHTHTHTHVYTINKISNCPYVLQRRSKMRQLTGNRKERVPKKPEQLSAEKPENPLAEREHILQHSNQLQGTQAPIALSKRRKSNISTHIHRDADY